MEQNEDPLESEDERILFQNNIESTLPGVSTTKKRAQKVYTKSNKHGTHLKYPCSFLGCTYRGQKSDLKKHSERMHK